MIETITALGFAKISTYTGWSVLTFVLLWMLKKIDNNKIAEKVELLFFGFGVLVTAGLSKWKHTEKFWNKTIEPWVIDLIDNVFGAAIFGFIRGLRSDNQKVKIQDLS